MSVYGTGGTIISLESFLGSMIRVNQIVRRLTVLSPSTSSADFPAKPISTSFTVLFRKNGDLSLLRRLITDCTGEQEY